MDNIGKFNLIAFSVLHTCFVKFPKATEFDYEELFQEMQHFLDENSRVEKVDSEFVLGVFNHLEKLNLITFKRIGYQFITGVELTPIGLSSFDFEFKLDSKAQPKPYSGFFSDALKNVGVSVASNIMTQFLLLHARM
ncbi:hypothetical protein [Vibrio anguillarum]|uniref:hypothetical protein n=1 Tax=Vibrio anguillarum TaxID=55601 RepID=UPI0030EDD982